MPPILCRGILIDVARLRGRVMNGGEEVSVGDIVDALAEAHVHVQPGDAVFIRTGWTKHWGHPATYSGEHVGSPGIGPAGAAWLADQGAGLVGSDTLVFERLDVDSSELPVHGLLLADRGVPIIEMLDLEELGDAGASEFFLIATPLRLTGATGSPVRPLALI